jgi:hypothetical protein
MKKYYNKLLSLVVAASILASCSKSSVPPNNTTATSPTSTDLTAALTSGNWVVSSFLQKTEDKTSKFSNIVFTFSANGTLNASDNGNTTTGTWSYTPAVTYYGSTSKAAIAINIGTSNPLVLLTKTWNLISSTSSTFKIDSPEIAEDEHVQFSKR